jgi:hypothetical protein
MSLQILTSLVNFFNTQSVSAANDSAYPITVGTRLTVIENGIEDVDLVLDVLHKELDEEEEIDTLDNGTYDPSRWHVLDDPLRRHVDCVNEALCVNDPRDSNVHARGFWLQFRGEISPQQLRFYVACINQTFLKAVSNKKLDVLRGDPSNWTYSMTDIPADSTVSFVYMKIARAKVSWHRKICEAISANLDGIHSDFTVRRAEQIFKDLEGFNPDDVINLA